VIFGTVIFGILPGQLDTQYNNDINVILSR